MEIIAPVVEEVSAQVWNDTNWSSPLLTHLKNIIEKKVQGRTSDSKLICFYSPCLVQGHNILSFLGSIVLY